TVNLLFAAVVSRQQLIQRDRQIADADAGGVIDGVGDGSGGADDAELANALHAYGVDVGVVLVDPGHVDLPDIGVGGDVVLGEVVVDVIAEAWVQHAFLVQRHRQSPRHPAQELRAGRLRTDGATGGIDPHEARHTHLAGIHVDTHLGKLS